MGDVLPIKRMNLRYPYFQDQIEPKGRLTLDRASHACWFYYMLADKNHQKVGRGPEDQILEVDPGLETPLWMDRNFDQIARSVAILYGFDSPDDYAKFMPVVLMELDRLGIEPVMEIFDALGFRL